MKKCGLLGCNIGYSKSPEIHTAYYRSKNIELDYSIFDVKEHQLSDFINKLTENDIIGFNVTVPYKEKIMKYIDVFDEASSKIGAVNTVLVKGNKLEGYNTDYFGFIKSLEEFKIDLTDGKALIIGAGGAAKSIYHGLLAVGCSSIDVACRNPLKANKYFYEHCNILCVSSLKNSLANYDILVNCTPLGGVNHLDELPIEIRNVKFGCIAYDLVYSPKITKFLEKAYLNNAIIINGEKMLIYQAYKAADIWINYINKKGDN